MISEQARNALSHDQTIDITTTGRRSGSPRRLEIWFHNLDGHIYITGLPGQRGWYANLLAHPDFTFHLKQTARAELPAHARPVTHRAERERVLRTILDRLGRHEALSDWVDRSPLVEVELLDE
jgi:deazaflavin-dependent oxidoreductase (nitroreductase family)